MSIPAECVAGHTECRNRIDLAVPSIPYLADLMKIKIAMATRSRGWE
jgi:hypothetical protein